MSFAESLTKGLAFLQIAISPLLIGLIIGAIVYYSKQDTLGMAIGIVIAILGLIIGVVLAIKISNKGGAVNFVSRISATPELDKKEEEDKK